MADHYVDPAAVGATNWTSWADAWVDLESACTNAVAGDTVYCRGTQTLAATITADTNAGAFNNPIIYVGMNALGVEDGTYFTLNGNAAVANCMTMNQTYYYMRNFRFTNATSHGMTPVGGADRRWTFYNCSFDNNGGMGADLTNNYRSTFLNCKFDNNTSHGMQHVIQPHIYYSQFIGNGGDGVRIGTGEAFGCIAHGNTGDGFDISGSGILINCVADGNANGVYASGSYNWIYNCRITNNTDGIEVANATIVRADYNFLLNNTSNYNLVGTGYVLDTGHTLTAGVEGYVNRAGDDFSTDTTATLRREQIVVGEYNA